MAVRQRVARVCPQRMSLAKLLQRYRVIFGASGVARTSQRVSVFIRVNFTPPGEDSGTMWYRVSGSKWLTFWSLSYSRLQSAGPSMPQEKLVNRTKRIERHNKRTL